MSFHRLWNIAGACAAAFAMSPAFAQTTGMPVDPADAAKPTHTEQAIKHGTDAGKSGHGTYKSGKSALDSGNPDDAMKAVESGKKSVDSGSTSADHGQKALGLSN